MMRRPDEQQPEDCNHILLPEDQQAAGKALLEAASACYACDMGNRQIMQIVERARLDAWAKNQQEGP